MRVLIAVALLMLATASNAATGSCTGGHGQLTEFYPCTVAQERAQERWFEASRKCWRGAESNLPGDTSKCLSSIRPKLKDFSR